jgi:hypothetical protein
MLLTGFPQRTVRALEISGRWISHGGTLRMRERTAASGRFHYRIDGPALSWAHAALASSPATGIDAFDISRTPCSVFHGRQVGLAEEDVYGVRAAVLSGHQQGVLYAGGAHA